MFFIDFICSLTMSSILLISVLNTTQNRYNMKNQEKFLGKKILCTLFGHHFIVSREVTEHFKEYKCTCCDLELTNDLRGHKTFLTPELKSINETLFYVNKRRHLLI